MLSSSGPANIAGNQVSTSIFMAVFRASPASAGGWSGLGGCANKTGHCVGWLRALADPILRPFVVEDEVVAFLQRLVGADFLNELAVARAAIVRHHYAEHGVVLRPDSFHPY